MFAAVLRLKTAQLICCSVPFPVPYGSFNIQLFANMDPLQSRHAHNFLNVFFSINRAHVTILEISIDCRSKICFFFSFQITSIVY